MRQRPSNTACVGGGERIRGKCGRGCRSGTRQARSHALRRTARNRRGAGGSPRSDSRTNGAMPREVATSRPGTTWQKVRACAESPRTRCTCAARSRFAGARGCRFAARWRSRLQGLGPFGPRCIIQLHSLMLNGGVSIRPPAVPAAASAARREPAGARDWCGGARRTCSRALRRNMSARRTTASRLSLLRAPASTAPASARRARPCHTATATRR